MPNITLQEVDDLLTAANQAAAVTALTGILEGAAPTAGKLGAEYMPEDVSNLLSAPAVGTITFANPITDWEFSFTDIIDILMYSGTALAPDVAAADLVTSWPADSPFTAAAVGGVVTLTAKVHGDLHNDYTISSLAYFDPVNAIVIADPANGSNGNSILNAKPIVTAKSPITGGIHLSQPYIDETLYLTPAGVLEAYTVKLPTASNSRIGQVKVVFLTQDVTSLTVTVEGGGSLVGEALAAAVANEAYTFQCVSTTGSGTWIRIS